MNKIYHSIWNERLQTWVAASEVATTKGKPSRSLCSTVIAMSCLLGAWSAQAAIIDVPPDGDLVSQSMTDGTVFNLLGNASISGGGQKSFSGKVTFNGQPGGSTITLGSNVKLSAASANSTIVGNNVTFSGGSSSSQGGALTSLSPVIISGTNISFNNNFSSSYGGAIHINRASSDNNLTITASKFTLNGNRSNTSGGGIWTNGNVTVTGDLDLTNNQSGGYGGAIRAENVFRAIGTDKAITILNNTTNNGGAGINVSNNILIEGTVRAESNIATNERGGVFRAVDQSTAGVNLTNAGTTHEFINNKAGVSGGAIVGNSHVEIAGNVVFQNNTAGQQGGAIHTMSTNSNAVTIGNASAIIDFTGNKAGYDVYGTSNFTGLGGAIYTPGTVTLTGQNITISDNVATNSGGAINAGALNLVATGNTTVTNNYAGADGGAFTLGSADTSLIHAQGGDITFSGNRSWATFLNGTPLAGSGTANALYLSTASILDLKAETGRKISFLDPITSSTATPAIRINAGGETGVVSFSGEQFAAGSDNVQSLVHASTTVYAGAFELKDNAEYGFKPAGRLFSVRSGAVFQSTGTLANVINQLHIDSISFQNGAVLAAQGNSELVLDANSVQIGTAAADIVQVSIGNNNQLTLSGTAFSGNGLIEKNGIGNLLLNNTNQFGNAQGLKIAAGKVDAQGHDQTMSGLYIEGNALLDMGASGGDLSITNQGYLAATGQMNNVNEFSKSGTGTFTFFESALIESLNHTNGKLQVADGKTIHVANHANIDGNNTFLDVAIGSPAIVANTALLANTPTINITGYNPLTETDTYNLIQTTAGVTTTAGQYFNATVAGVPIQDYVTLDHYLIGSSFIDSSGKNVVAGLTLVWNNPMTNGAHGTFNITGDNSFDVGVALADNVIPGALGFGWNGQDLTKTGTGTLILNGVNTYTGHTDVQNGRLILGSTAVHNNAQIAGNVDVQNAALLGGHGRVNGTVTVHGGGTLAPGNSVGTLTVGDALFNSGSTFQVEVNPDGTADRLVADSSLGGTGTVTINAGSGLDIIAGAGNWNPSTSYLIIDTDGGVTGQFDQVKSNLAFLTETVNYNIPNQVWLTMIRNETGFGDLDGTYNQNNAGQGIESLGGGHALYDTIVGMSREQALSAFDNLSGEIYGSVASALLTNRYARDSVNRHLSNGTTLRTNQLDANKALWIDTWGYDGRLQHDGNATKLDYNGWGFLVGADAYSNGTTAVGVALGYEQTDIKARSNRNSDADIDAVHLLAYGRTSAGPIDIKAGIGYSWLDVDVSRHINVGAIQSTNDASYDGSLIQAYAEGSHTFDLTEQTSITPYVNVAYQHISTDSFTEKGLNAQLHHNRSSNHLVTTTTGVRGLWELNEKGALYGELGWQHNMGDIAPHAQLNFIGGSVYRVRGAEVDRNSAIIGFGGNYQINNDMHLSAGYEGQYGDQNRSHALKVQFQWSF